MKPLSKKDIFWHNHIKAFLTSGLIQADYCRKHGLNSKTFSVRKHQYLKLNKKQSADSFVPLNSSNKEISIKLGNGIVLNFDQTTDPTWIAKLISSVEINYAQH